jgi:anti-anti-sigma factor
VNADLRHSGHALCPAVAAHSRSKGGHDDTEPYLLAAQRRPGNKGHTHPAENEPTMTIVHRLNTADGDLGCDGHQLTIDRDGVDMRAQLRHLATVLTVSGDIDARNIDRVSAYATRLVPVGNALLLDLSGVGFFAAQGISVLVAVGDACGDAGLPWALVTSHAVDRVLRISEDDDILPVASSVPDAMRYFADLARVRQQVPLSRVRSMSLERQPVRDETGYPLLSSARGADQPMTRGDTGPVPASYLCTG